MKSENLKGAMFTITNVQTGRVVGHTRHLTAISNFIRENGYSLNPRKIKVHCPKTLGLIARHNESFPIFEKGDPPVPIFFVDIIRSDENALKGKNTDH